jgi:hypothetical protein
MDMPIKVMMTLFIALVVSSVIILFARNTVDDARRQMLDIGKTNPEKIVDKGTADVSASEIVYLAQSCYEAQKSQALSKELCYIVHGTINTDKATVSSQLTSIGILNDVDFPSGTSTLLVYYNPADNKVKITK